MKLRTIRKVFDQHGWPKEKTLGFEWPKTARGWAFYSLLVTCYFLLFTRYFLLVVRYFLLVITYSLLVSTFL